ncbi:MAG: serine/threonine protein kinase [Proteobacteria bacterium]|nr:serine/threonine protein kinase [Pseudomonadota bacterium]
MKRKLNLQNNFSQNIQDLTAPRQTAAAQRLGQIKNTQPEPHAQQIKVSEQQTKAFVATLPDAPSVQTPQRLSMRYRYIKLLGEGSNGKTYLAQNKRTGANVAIKALKLIQNESFKSFELFKREAETLSSIKVKGVPKFCESILSNTPGGECYIVQEYIQAPSIQSYLDSGRIFTEQETLILMSKVTAILHELHSRYSPPIIHRDIKPSNILCQLPKSHDLNDWKQIQPYLIDFGAVANANSYSDKSTIAGTVGYMAPEQNFGECLPQTDFYALGATALHMITGIPPYEMDFETYTLKFEQYIDKQAKSTSKPTRELLRSLLNYNYDKRPENAEKLQAMITDILPDEDKTHAIKRFFQSIHNQFNKFASKIKQTLSLIPNAYYIFEKLDPSNKDCVLTYGKIQNAFNDTSLEYTFTVNGMTWSGVTPGPFLQIPCDSLPAQPFPKTPPPAIDTTSATASSRYVTANQIISRIAFHLPCAVIYNRNDPSCNKLYYIFTTINEPK